MKKLILSVAVGIITMATVNAQQSIKYQGDVQLGYSIGIGAIPQDRVNFHFINSMRFTDHFSAGVGTGLELYTNFVYDAPELALPLFLNVRGYMPVNLKTTLFVSFDLGASIGITEGMNGMSGLMLVPAVGASFKTANSKAITVSLGYNYQAWSESIFSVNTDAVTIKLGFSL